LSFLLSSFLSFCSLESGCHSRLLSSMPSPYDVYIKSAKPLETQPEEEGGARPCTLRLGQNLIATHRELIESLPVLSELAAQQDSIDTVSLSSLLKHQPCLTPDGIKLLLDFVYGKEAYVKPKMVADILAAANSLRVDDLISQIENELMRLVGYDDSILFSLEHAILNMDEESSARYHIIQAAVTRLDKISTHSNFGKILWPTFEMLMKYATIDSSSSVFMNAFISWVNVNRHDQTRACSLLFSSKFHELTVVEKEEFAQRSASLYLHGVSSAMSKLTGSAPFTEKRVLTHRWSTSSDLSISSSVDVVAIHEEPFTNTNITVDCSQLSEYGHIYSDIEDSIVDSLLEEEES
ncbi:hypothetical protein PENTCL1PPCAC_2841, partial [Pristionchus entomophagus]